MSIKPDVSTTVEVVCAVDDAYNALLGIYGFTIPVLENEYIPFEVVVALNNDILPLKDSDTIDVLL